MRGFIHDPYKVLGIARDATQREVKQAYRRLEKEIEKLKRSEKEARRELQQSFDRMRKTMGGIIQAMSLTIEERDPYTAGHQRQMGMDSSSLQQALD